MMRITPSVRTSPHADGGPKQPAPRASGDDDGTLIPASEASDDPVFGAIAAGLFHLRRTWAKPVMHRLKMPGRTGRPLQLSNLMVVYALGVIPAAIDEAEPDAGHTSHAGRSHLGDENAEMTIGDIADRLEIDPSTASRLVGHAISAGLVSRRPSPVDARRASLRLTEAGHRLRQVADRYRHRYLATLMADWSTEERNEFARLLTRFSEAASRRPMQLDGVDKIFEEAMLDDTAQQDHHHGGR